jgi:hypothetical protein
MARADTGCTVWHQDFLALDLPQRHFDGIFANASLFHVPSRELPRVLIELRGALKPGGVLFASNPRGTNEEGWSRGRYGTYHDLAAWRRYLERAGFVELDHYYRPAGLPREQQAWLASVWRNPGGDRALYCGDVQQNSFEEISIISRGANLGWRRMEGDKCFDFAKPDGHPATCDQAGLTLPIIVYNNCTAVKANCKGISVTGGHVYRGPHQAWQGKYIFGDWSKSFATMDGQIFFGTKGGDGKWTMEVAAVDGMQTVPYILAFAQDDKGEVYALTSITTGPVGGHDKVYKIVPAN